MSTLGSNENPLRVAIIGSGPTGFYTADHLFKQKDFVVTVDMFERLPTPFGLVRYGVAPDHPKIKSVTKIYGRIAKKPGFRFFGNVMIGKDISVAELEAHYHQIVYTTGAETDRPLNILGEELDGSLPATEFVAWYNGHPDYKDYQVDLSGKSVAVVGVGNVAMDIARILARTPTELATTDISDRALETLRHSKIENIYILGRRGPSQAAFTTPEIKELGEMEDATCFVLPEEAKLDKLSEAALADSADRATMKKIGIIQSYTERNSDNKSRQITVRFLVSPTELIGDENGRVSAMRLVKNELYKTESGTLRPRATEQYEEIPVDLVFRAIGYRGVPIPTVPFHDRWGIIMNERGRVVDTEAKEHLVGHYTAGWIKRGPSGVIGTNKPDALETVKCMLEDVVATKTLQPTETSEALTILVAQRKPDYFSYADWQRLDDLETTNGIEQGRPRVKFTSVAEMKTAIGKT